VWREVLKFLQSSLEVKRAAEGRRAATAGEATEEAAPRGA